MLPDPADGATLDARDALLERCILALESGGEAAVEPLLVAAPEHAAAVRQQLQQLSALGILSAPTPANVIPERLGDFRLQRVLGRGGMGVVYLATQESLGREVALKLLHPQQLLLPGLRERFRREVLAVARLSHPGIVPVYSCGEADGIPYYAMERLHGASLAEVLQELHAVPPGELPATALAAALTRLQQRKGEPTALATAPVFADDWPRACCRLLRSAALAVQHAHDHRVLHRDLKPSNLFLTADGELRVIDFGLATTAGATRVTRTGSTLGSLPYMAPEQVRGQWQAVDARSDVYALGVTLYELLALQLPHGDGSGTTHERILAGGAPRPSRSNPRIAADLDAIVLTAIDPDPARRYQSAGALAHDLGNFLEHRSVAARPPALALRLWRWSKRHPTRATALAATSAAVVLGPLVFGLQQAAAHRQLTAAFALVDRQRERAERNLDAALQAVDAMLVRTSEARLNDVPRTAALRRQLLEDAVALQQQLLPTEGDSPRLREDRARAQGRIGRLRVELGDLDGAATALGVAITELRQLLPTSERPLRLQRELANACDAEARRLGSIGRPEEQLRMADATLASLQALRAATPADRQVAMEIARLRTNRCQVLSRLRRADEARDELDRLDRELAPDQRPAGVAADDEDWQLAWSRAAAGRGLLLAQGGDTLAAQAAMQEALQRLEQAAAGPHRTQVRSERATVRQRLALLAKQRRQWEEAAPLLEAAVQELGALVADEPEVTSWRAALATVLGSRADNAVHLDRLEAAAADHDRAVAMFEELHRQSPDDSSHGLQLAIAYGERATLHLRRQDLQAALTDFAGSAAVLESELQLHPDHQQARANLLATLANQARAQASGGDLPAARATTDRAVAESRTLTFGEVGRTRTELLLQAGELALAAADLATAADLLAQAGAQAAAWLAVRPDDPLRLFLAATVASTRGIVSFRRDDPAAAAACWQEALPWARQCRGKAGKDSRTLVGELLLQLAAAAVAQQQPEAARRWFQAAVQDEGATAAQAAGFPPAAALFARPELQDLLPRTGTGR